MIKSKLHSNKLLNIILLFFFFSSLGFSNTFKGTSLLMNKESIKKDNKHQQQSFKKEEGEAISCDFEACINNNCGEFTSGCGGVDYICMENIDTTIKIDNRGRCDFAKCWRFIIYDNISNDTILDRLENVDSTYYNLKQCGDFTITVIGMDSCKRGTEIEGVPPCNTGGRATLYAVEKPNVFSPVLDDGDHTFCRGSDVCLNWIFDKGCSRPLQSDVEQKLYVDGDLVCTDNNICWDSTSSIGGTIYEYCQSFNEIGTHTITVVGKSYLKYKSDEFPSYTKVCRTDTFTKTFKILPDFSIDSIEGPFHSCGDTSTYCIKNPTDNGDYNWTVQGGAVIDTQNTCAVIDWNVSKGGTITAIHPCSSDSAKLEVDPCCTTDSDSGHLVYDTTEQYFVNKFGSSTVSTTDEIVINGILTVQNDFTFINTPHIKMGPKAKIKVVNGSTFKLDSSHIQAGCGSMWDGIYVCSERNSVVVQNGSKLEDAENAIVSINYGDFDISHSTLDRNWKHVKVILDEDKPCNIFGIIGEHPGSMRNVDFVSTGGNLLAPHGKAPRTHIGVEVFTPPLFATPFTQPIHIIIGDTADADFENTFDGLDLGIKSRASQIEVYNNKFANIRAGAAPDQKGTSIYNRNYKSSAPFLIVGGNDTNEPNTFENGYRGVYNRGGTTMKVINNEFDNFYETGVTSKFNIFDSIKVNGNNMVNMMNGVKMFRNQHSNIEIKQNSIDLIPAIYIPSPATRGIMVQEISPSALTNPTVEIAHNQISSVTRQGIWVRNVRGTSASSNPFIHNNNVQIKPPVLVTKKRSGIRVDNCKFAKITENKAHSLTNNSNVVRGIEVQFSQSPLLKCNVTREVDWGISHRNFNRPAFNKANTMKNTHRGFVIWDDGNVGPQGQKTSTTPKRGITWDNIWENNTMDLWATDGGGKASRGDSSAFHLRDIRPYFVPVGKTGAKTGCSGGFCSKMSRTIYNHPVEVVNPIISCCPPPYCDVASVQEKRERIIHTGRKIAQDQVDFTSKVSEQRWMTRHSLFHTLNTDTTLLNDDTTGVLRQFYRNVKSNTLGELCRACRKAFALTPADSADQRNRVKNELNNISPTNQQETYLKEVANIHIKTMARGDRTFNTSQIKTLQHIAGQCPTEGGQAVFYARAIYHNMINDTVNFEKMCLSGFHASKRSTETSSPRDSLQYPGKFTLYPTVLNRNEGIRVVAPEQAELRLYNTLGRQVAQHRLQGGQNRLSTQGLHTGVYIYKIVHRGVPKQRGKLIIK